MAVPTDLSEALALLTASSGNQITGQDVRDVVTWLSTSATSEAPLPVKIQPLAEIDAISLLIGNGPYQPGSTPWLVDIDGFDFELAWQQAADLPVGANLEVFSADDATPTNRATFIKWDGSALTWTFGVRASTYWTIDDATDNSLYQYACAGDCISARFSYWPSRGTAFVRLTINGCFTSDIALDSPPVSGGDIAKPSTLYLGSNRGTNATAGSGGAPLAPCILGHIERFTGRRHADSGPTSPEIVISGDSIMSSRGGVTPPGGGVYTEQEALDRPGILNISKGGAQILGQETDFLAKVKRGDPSIRLVYVEMGVNNILGGATGVATFADARRYVRTIRSWLPNAKIVWGKASPCDAFLSAPQRVEFAAYQALLPTLDGIDLYWDSHYATLGAGTANLAAAYDSGDGIHPNPRGARLLGRSIRAAAEQLEVLPAIEAFSPLARWSRTLTGLFLAEGHLELSGAAVQRWTNAARVKGRNLRVVSSAPTYDATGGPTGGPCLTFASASRQLLSSTADGWAWRDAVSYDGGYMACIFKATTINSNLANIWENDAVVGSPQLLTGIHLKTGGGTPTVNAYQYSGASPKVASDTGVDTTNWHLAQWNFRNGQLYVKLDGRPVQSIAHGPALQLAGYVQLGEAGAATSSFNGRIESFVTRSVPCTDEELDSMYAWAQSRGV